MKKVLSIFLMVLILINPAISLATEIEDEDFDVEHTESTEIRDQNIFVPTKNGVQRATYEEATNIAVLRKYDLSSLCKSYLLGDYKTGRIVEEYNIDEVRAMASTSKLVSIFVVMDQIADGKLNKKDVVKIDAEASNLKGSTYELKENDERTVEQLIEASLVVSGNDAITALAKYIAGSTDAFVEMMNDKCKELGLTTAHMVNPTGLTDYSIEDYNKMSTRDMFKLSRELLKEYPEILKITSLPSISEPERNYLKYSTNPILGIVEGIDGLKTGYTNAAGRCLIATGTSKGDGETTQDTRLIGIVTGLGGGWKRYVASSKLMEEGFKKYKYTIVGDTEKPISNINIENAATSDIPVYEKSKGSLLWDNKTQITRKFREKDGLQAPLVAGDLVGYVEYTIDGDQVLKTEAIVKGRVPEKGIINRLRSLYQEIFRNMEKEFN